MAFARDAAYLGDPRSRPRRPTVPRTMRPTRSVGASARVPLDLSGDGTEVGVDAKVTLRDVARLAGVHPATASRALNEEARSLVREETALRVAEAARALDYRPDHLARSLKTRRTATIGVLVPDITNPLFPPILRGIEDQLNRKGYVALIGNTDNDHERERRVVTEMRDRSIDGLIVATARRHHPLLVESSRGGLPIVLVNRVVEDHVLPSVSVDDQMGIRAAVAHLVLLGHRRIAHVAGPQELSTGNGRYLGFLAGLEASGIEADPALVAFANSFSEAEGFRCTEELFATGHRFTAIVAVNDMLALGALRSMRLRGVVCPDAMLACRLQRHAFDGSHPAAAHHRASPPLRDRLTGRPAPPRANDRPPRSREDRVPPLRARRARVDDATSASRVRGRPGDSVFSPGRGGLAADQTPSWRAIQSAA